MRTRRHARALVLLSTVVAMVAASADEPFPALKNPHEDEPMLAACNPAELRRLEAAVRELSKGRSPDQAWTLVRHALCGLDASSRRHVARHLPKRISSSSYYTGEENETVRLVDSALDFMAKGHAWSADAVARGDGIAVTYASAEVCVSDFTLAWRGGDWLVVGIGFACD